MSLPNTLFVFTCICFFQNDNQPEMETSSRKVWILNTDNLNLLYGQRHKKMEVHIYKSKVILNLNKNLALTEV